jgi:hypothetical protein
VQRRSVRRNRADFSHSADGNRTTSGFRVSRRHAIRFLVAVPAAMRSVQRSPRAQGNSPAFADMLVMEPTARDHAAMRRFRRKARSSPVYFEFIQLIDHLRRIIFANVCI